MVIDNHRITRIHLSSESKGYSRTEVQKCLSFFQENLGLHFLSRIESTSHFAERKEKLNCHAPPQLPTITNINSEVFEFLPRNSTHCHRLIELNSCFADRTDFRCITTTDTDEFLPRGLQISFEDTLRRFAFQKQPGREDGPSFAELQNKIRGVFQLQPSAALFLTYTDNENDIVTMESDDDLRDASVIQALNPLRISVKLSAPHSDSSSENSHWSGRFGAPSSCSASLPFDDAFGGLEEPFRQLLKKLSPAAESLHSLLQIYAPMFEGLEPPSQLPDLMESIVKVVASQVSSAGEEDSSNAPTSTDIPTSCRPPSTHSDNSSASGSCASMAKNSEDIAWKNGPNADQFLHQMRLSPSAMMAMCSGLNLDARFIRHVSIFDGTQLAPGTRFTKIWRLRNIGTIPWPATTKLVQIGGDDLGSESMTPLEIAHKNPKGLDPEEEIDASVDCIAPQLPGRYSCHWRLSVPGGPTFGHQISVRIQVVAEQLLDQLAQVVGGADDDEESVEGAVPSSGAFETELETTVASQQNRASGPVRSTEIGDSGVIHRNPEKEMIMANDSDDAADMGIDSESSLVDNTADIGKESIDASGKVAIAANDSVGRTMKSPQDTIFSVPSSALKKAGTKSTSDGSKIGNHPQELEGQLAKLEAMGFDDTKLNVEILETNNLDLRKTVEDLCAAEKCGPMLVQLEEMGFYDIEMNQRLMVKHKGSIKRVVQELVTLSSEATGKGKQLQIDA